VLEWWSLKLPSPQVPAPELAGRGRLVPLGFGGFIKVIAHHGSTIAERCDIFKCILKRVLISTNVRGQAVERLYESVFVFLNPLSSLPPGEVSSEQSSVALVAEERRAEGRRG
jgi:hypothetical protein